MIRIDSPRMSIWEVNENYSIRKTSEDLTFSTPDARKGNSGLKPESELVRLVLP